MPQRGGVPRPVRLNINAEVPTPFVVPFTWYRRARLCWSLPKPLVVTVSVIDEPSKAPDTHRYSAVAHEDDQFGLRCSFASCDALTSYTGYHLVGLRKVGHAQLHYTLSRGCCPCAAAAVQAATAAAVAPANMAAAAAAAGGAGPGCAGCAGAAAAVRCAGAAIAAARTDSCEAAAAVLCRARNASDGGAAAESCNAAGIDACPGRQSPPPVGPAAACPAAVAAAVSLHPLRAQGSITSSGLQAHAGTAAAAVGKGGSMRPPSACLWAGCGPGGRGEDAAAPAAGDKRGLSSSGSGCRGSEDGGALPARSSEGGSDSARLFVRASAGGTTDSRRSGPGGVAGADSSSDGEESDPERPTRTNPFRSGHCSCPCHVWGRWWPDPDDPRKHQGDEEPEAERGRSGARGGKGRLKRQRCGSSGERSSEDAEPPPPARKQKRAGPDSSGGRGAAHGAASGAAATIRGQLAPHGGGGLGGGLGKPPLPRAGGSGRPPALPVPAPPAAGASGGGPQRQQSQPGQRQRGAQASGAAATGSQAAGRGPPPRDGGALVMLGGGGGGADHPAPAPQLASPQRPSPGSGADRRAAGAIVTSPTRDARSGAAAAAARITAIATARARRGRAAAAAAAAAAGGSGERGEGSRGTAPGPPTTTRGAQDAAMGAAVGERAAGQPQPQPRGGAEPVRAARQTRAGAAAKGGPPAQLAGPARAPPPPGPALPVAASSDEPQRLPHRLSGGAAALLPAEVLDDFVGRAGYEPRGMVLEVDGVLQPQLVYAVTVARARRASRREQSHERALLLHGVPSEAEGLELHSWGMCAAEGGECLLVARTTRPPPPQPRQQRGQPTRAVHAPHAAAPTQEPLPVNEQEQQQQRPSASGRGAAARPAAEPLPSLMLAPPGRPTCRAAWDVQPVETSCVRPRRGTRIQGDRLPVDPALLHGMLSRRVRDGASGADRSSPGGQPPPLKLVDRCLRLFVERDGYVDVCTGAWCALATEARAAAFLDNVPPHAQGCFFLGWGVLPGGSLVLRVSSAAQHQAATAAASAASAGAAAGAADTAGAAATAAAAAAVAAARDSLRKRRRAHAYPPAPLALSGKGSGLAAHGSGSKRPRVALLQDVLSYAPALPTHCSSPAPRPGATRRDAATHS